VRTGGSDGNERLTGIVGAILLILLAAEGITILQIGQLLSWHVFIGMVLIPPVVLKLGSTGYRFLRYYGRIAEYRLKGPPQLLMRVLVAPIFVLSTLVVLGSGVALVVAGRHHGWLVGLHKASFVVWGVAFAVHILAYALKLPPLIAAEWSKRPALGGRRLRVMLVAVALLAGAGLAVATLPLAHSWEHSRSRDDRGGG
jgi:hypothetical protein